MASHQPKYWQPDFDPSATFTVAAWPAGYTVRGHAPRRGEVFNTQGFRPQLLRSMYESRWIEMAEPAKVLPIDRTTERGGAGADDLLATIGDFDTAGNAVAQAAAMPKRSRAGRGVV